MTDYPVAEINSAIQNLTQQIAIVQGDIDKIDERRQQLVRDMETRQDKLAEWQRTRELVLRKMKEQDASGTDPYSGQAT